MLKKTYLTLLIGCFICSYGNAQEDDKEKTLEEEQDSVVVKDLQSKIVRIKKYYELGDGLTLLMLGGDIRIRQSLQLQYSANSSDNFNTINSQFRVRRARFNISGNLFDNKFYFRFRLNFPGNFQSSTSGSRSFNNLLQDAYVEYKPASNQRINIGQRAEYCDTREVRVEGESLGFIERSAVSTAFDPIFDFGIRYSGDFRLGGSNLFRPYLSITTGDGTAGLQKNYGGFKYGLRLDYLPFGAFSRGGEYYFDDLAYERKPKLVVGLILSYNDGQTSPKGTNGGRWIYGDSSQKILLPDIFKIGFDFMFKYKGFYAYGDLVQTKAFVPAGIKGEFNLNGNFNSYAGQTSTQINATVLSRLNVGTGLNIQAGYLINKWAVGARYTLLHQAEQSAAFADQNKYYSFIATRYFAEHNLKIQFETGYEEYKEALKTDLMKGNIYGRIMFTVQL